MYTLSCYNGDFELCWIKNFLCTDWSKKGGGRNGPVLLQRLHRYINVINQIFNQKGRGAGPLPLDLLMLKFGRPWSTILIYILPSGSISSLQDWVMNERYMNNVSVLILLNICATIFCKVSTIFNACKFTIDWWVKFSSFKYRCK